MSDVGNRTSRAAWRVYYRPRGSEEAWLTDGLYTHEEAVRRVFEIRGNDEEQAWDAYTGPVSFSEGEIVIRRAG